MFGMKAKIVFVFFAKTCAGWDRERVPAIDFPVVCVEVILLIVIIFRM